MPLLGCIADDFTGALDLASTLVRAGMRTVQMMGVPEGALPADADAVVVALRSRTAPPAEAVRDSLAALDALLGAGCQQIYFKVCSTFDSTDEGNIGPVADALLRRLGAGFAPVCPAFPADNRTIFQGHLFVGASLLNESGMERHALTPMRDPNLVRVLGRQTDGGVGLIPFAVVEEGAGAIRTALSSAAESGRRYAVVDAASDAHLFALGEAASRLPLLVGGSGAAMGLPENFRAAGLLPVRADADALPQPVQGMRAVLAGSCSRTTLAQIGLARDQVPVLELDPLPMPDPAALADAALSWCEGRLSMDRPVVIAASAPPARVEALRRRLGREAADALVERAMAEIAAGLVARGVRQLVVAGGETAAAVVSRLRVRALRIGAEIDPGVPWTSAEGAAVPDGMRLALRSGNSGARDFFLKAFRS